MRRLVAALACRSEGSRLYGKPMQNLDVAAGVTILDHIVDALGTVDCIDEVVLGVSEGAANAAYVEFAEGRGMKSIRGDRDDVLMRLIQCGEAGGATDVFRITSESPYCHYEAVAEAWERHLAHGNDVTTIDPLPDGCHFEIYTLETLRRSHELGDATHRSEACNRYVREHRDDFRVEVLDVPPALARNDLRLTVDNPEDLILCRAVYAELKVHAPRIPLAAIVDFLDRSPELRARTERFVSRKRIW